MDLLIIRFRWLLGDTLIILLIDMISRIRPLIGLPSLGGKEEQEWIVENIPAKPSVILDIGASESLLRLRLRNTGHQILPIDIRFLRGIDFKPFFLGDATQLPFREEVLDCVILCTTIEHIGLGAYGDLIYTGGDLLVMQEVGRVLRKGGCVLITTMYATEGGMTWERHYSDEMIEKLSEGFITVNKMYLLNADGFRQPWIKKMHNIPRVEPADPAKAIVCIKLKKQLSPIG